MNAPFFRTASGADHIFGRQTDINIGDIATALSRIPRFNGHTIRPYPVAAHSLWVSRAILKETGDVMHALGGLMHDAHEAYVGDMATPVQQYVFGSGWPSRWKIVTEELDHCIADALALPHWWRTSGEVVAHFDRLALRAEWRELMPGREPAEFENIGLCADSLVDVTDCRAAFLSTFHDLRVRVDVENRK